MTNEDRADPEAEYHQWAVEQRLPGAEEAKDAWLDRKAAEWGDLGDRIRHLLDGHLIFDPRPLTVEQSQRVAVAPVYRRDPDTGEFVRFESW